MKVALFANMQKSASREVIEKVASFLKEKGVTVVVQEEFAKESCSSNDLSYLISLGGDGTILRLIHNFPHLTAPVVGINLGRLGFMADIPLSALYSSLEQLIAGEVEIEELMIIEGLLPHDKTCFAINDLVVHRAHNPSLIDLSIQVDGLYLNTFSADGIIISTPNGSTAYSLSAGGPILTPTLNAVVITPINPHTISNRPIVLLPTQFIEIEYLSHYAPVEVTHDGFSDHTLSSNEKLKIRVAKKKFKTVKLKGSNYFSTLRTKLNWSGQVRL